MPFTPGRLLARPGPPGPPGPPAPPVPPPPGFPRSQAFYCRRNGRAFRIIQGKDKRWTLYRIKEVSDKGELLGTYRGRGDANKALQTIAYTSNQADCPSTAEVCFRLRCLCLSTGRLACVVYFDLEDEG